MNPLDQLPNSPRRLVLDVVMSVLQNSAAIQSTGAVLLRNPRGPVVAEAGSLLLIVQDGPDTLGGYEGGRQVRESTFTLAAVARLSNLTGTQQADDHADRLHYAAAQAISASQAEYSGQQGKSRVRIRSLVKEVATLFKLENIEVDGALVASTWSFRYQKD